MSQIFKDISKHLDVKTVNLIIGNIQKEKYIELKTKCLIRVLPKAAIHKNRNAKNNKYILMSVIITDINFVCNYSRKIFADAKNMYRYSFALLYNSVNCLLSFAQKYVNITQNSHFFVVCSSSSNVIWRGRIFHRITCRIIHNCEV